MQPFNQSQQNQQNGHSHPQMPQGYSLPYGMPYMPPYMPMPYPGMVMPDPALMGMPRENDPLEERIRRYNRAAQETTAAPQGQPGDEKLSSMITAAVTAMEQSVRDNERKTAAALDALAGMVDRSKAPQTPKSEEKSDVHALTNALQSLIGRLDSLEKNIGERTEKTAESGTGKDSDDQQHSQKQPQHEADMLRIEDQLGDVLDSLGGSMRQPGYGSSRMSPQNGGIRPRVNIVRSAGGTGALAVNDAVSDITARQRMLSGSHPQATLREAESSALEAIRRSISAISEQMHDVRRDMAPAETYDIRNELRDLQTAVEELAPRRIVSSINESIRALATRIEQSREEGVRDSRLVPLEKLLADIRLSVEKMREPKELRSIQESLNQLALRVDDIGANSIDARQVNDFQRHFSDIRAMVADTARQQPLDQLEHHLRTLSAKVDELAARPRDNKATLMVAESVDAIRGQLDRINPDRALSRIEERFEGLSSIAARLDELASRFEHIPANTAPQPGIDDLRMRIEKMTQLISNRGAADLSPLVNRIDEMRASLSQVQPPPQFDLSPVLRRIEEMHATLPKGSIPADLTPLMHRIDEMREQLHRGGGQTDLSPILHRLDEMRQHISHTGGNVDLSSIERRLDDLQHSMDRRPAAPDMRNLEQILQKLADRIETVRGPSTSTAALDALENHVAKIAARMELGNEISPSMDGIEHTLQQLCGTIASLRDTTAEAAQDAVRNAMMNAPGDPVAAEGMFLIKRDLTDMKNVHAESDRVTRESLQSVQNNLESIVAKLSMLEHNLHQAPARAMAAPHVPAAMPQVQAVQQAVMPQIAPAPAMAKAPPPILAAPPITPAIQVAPAHPLMRDAAPPAMMAPAPFQDGDGLDMPLEPGAGRAGAAAVMETAAGSDPRANFIAAARKAAQAAATQSAGVLAEMDGKKGKKAGKAAKTEGATSGGLKATLAKHRKPLILALAALVMAIGGVKIVSEILMPGTAVQEAPMVQPAPELAPEKQSSYTPNRLQSDRGQNDGRPIDMTAGIPAPANDLFNMAGKPIDQNSVGSIPTTIAPGSAGEATDVSGLIRASTTFRGPDTLKQAASDGNLSAIYEIGARLAEGRGTPRDLKLAARWLELAANQGFAPAQYRYGSFFREGIGASQDPKQAFVWFQRAAEKGHILAMHNLAVLYAEGVNGSPDYASAATWFRNAAEHGVKDSQFNIAILYVRGLGVTQDMNEAYKWFAAAAAQGDQDAIKKRDEVGARLTSEKLTEAKKTVEMFRAKRPDPRANDVPTPDGGWDAVAQKLPAKKTRA